MQEYTVFVGRWNCIREFNRLVCRYTSCLHQTFIFTVDARVSGLSVCFVYLNFCSPNMFFFLSSFIYVVVIQHRIFGCDFKPIKESSWRLLISFYFTTALGSSSATIGIFCGDCDWTIPNLLIPHTQNQSIPGSSFYSLGTKWKLRPSEHGIWLR